jgi:intein/homing endonuclease
LTPDGLKNIEDIEVGDWVISDDPETEGGVVAKQVTRTFERTDNNGIVDIEIGDEVISTTGNHEFWLDGEGWVEAKDIEEGDLLWTEDGDFVAVDGIEKREGTFEVYNFEVDDFHTYFVSQDGVLVHNVTCSISGAEYEPNKLGRPFTDDEALVRGSEVFNRSPVAASGNNKIRGALGTDAGHFPGHPKDHNISFEKQADIINNPERTFVGINKTGRHVSVFFKDEVAVITVNNNTSRVITAYGKGGHKGGIPDQPVKVETWENNSNYVEIRGAKSQSNPLPKLLGGTGR